MISVDANNCTSVTFGCRRMNDCDAGLVGASRLHHSGTRKPRLVPVQKATTDMMVSPIPVPIPQVHLLTYVKFVAVLRICQPDLTLRVVATTAVWLCKATSNGQTNHNHEPAFTTTLMAAYSIRRSTLQSTRQLIP